MRKVKSSVFLSLLAPLVVLAGSCGLEPGPRDDADGNGTAASVCDRPKKILLLIDQSLSMGGNNRFRVDEIIPLVDLIASCGGELGVAFIRGTPDGRIERLTIPGPPPPPEKPVPVAAEETYEFEDRIFEYEEAVRSREMRMAETRAELEPRIADFFVRVTWLLDRRAARSTDLNSALNRAGVFFAETAADRDGADRILFLASDARDTAGAPLRPLPDGIRVIWIDGTSDPTILADLNPARFEGFAAAVRSIMPGTE